MKISEYPSITSFAADDTLLVDGANGTRKALATDALYAILDLISHKNHKSIFRGKNLGSTVTDAQKAAIQDGSFNDLWLGDYWVINGVTWRIVDFDYWYNTGDTRTVKHHVVLMPDTVLYDAMMNDTATAAGGYVGSQMYTANLQDAKTAVESAFGTFIYSHREYLVNAISDGKPSAGAWYDSTVEIPNELMIHGSRIYGADGHVSTIDKNQLALFAIAPEFANIGDIYWLRDVVSATAFARVYSGGLAQYYDANTSVGVRPVFAIG